MISYFYQFNVRGIPANRSFALSATQAIFLPFDELKTNIINNAYCLSTASEIGLQKQILIDENIILRQCLYTIIR